MGGPQPSPGSLVSSHTWAPLGPPGCSEVSYPIQCSPNPPPTHTPLPGFRVCPNSTCSSAFWSLGSKRGGVSGSLQISSWGSLTGGVQESSFRLRGEAGSQRVLNPFLLLGASLWLPSASGSQFLHHFGKGVEPGDPRGPPLTCLVHPPCLSLSPPAEEN